MPTISSGAVSLRIPITVSCDVVAGLLVAHLDRDRVEGPPRSRSRASSKSGGTPKFQLSRRGTIVLSTTASPGCVRIAVPDLLRPSRSRARSAPSPNVVCVEERPVEARGRGRSPRAAPVPSCFASTASTDWLPTSGSPTGRYPGALASAARHVVDRRRADGAGAHLEPAAVVVDVDRRGRTSRSTRCR